jgi:hypothetical protein
MTKQAERKPFSPSSMRSLTRRLSFISGGASHSFHVSPLRLRAAFRFFALPLQPPHLCTQPFEIGVQVFKRFGSHPSIDTLIDALGN